LNARILRIKRSRPHDLPESAVTDEAVFRDRRRLLKTLGFVGAAGLLARPAAAALSDPESEATAPRDPDFVTTPLDFSRAHPRPPDAITTQAKASGHNNFYEFGHGKEDPRDNAQHMRVDPWELRVSGAVAKPLALGYEDLYRFDLEERIYRLRCVEAWSMVIPWVGFPLATLLKRADPAGSARYVAFQTLYDPEEMPAQGSSLFGGGITYPYVEGLRLDEAMHPLTLLAVGVYGKTLPPQNGAPIRLVVPWKYGFKSIKSIVGISLTDTQPPTSWNLAAPDEYGFYANVNPGVDHPRWSQASERRITRGGLGSDERIPTTLFNGYGDAVAGLYAGMDLRRHF